MAGLIYGVMSGAGEGLMKTADHVSRSALQRQQEEAQRLRDERLAELHEQAEIRGEERRRAPFKAAAAEIEQAKTGMVDDQSGTVRARTPAEMAQAEESAYRKQGLVSEAMQVRQLEGQREERNERKLDRSADNARADRAEDRAQRTFDITAKGADLDRQIKQITLDNAKRQADLRKEFSTADPARKKAIEDEMAILTGKDQDNFLPVPLKDDMGNITGYKVFDKKRGAWVEDKPGGAQPSEADIEGLKKRAGNQAAVDFFEAKYGKGSAAKHIGSQKPKAKGDRIVAGDDSKEREASDRELKSRANFGPLTAKADLARAVALGNPHAKAYAERANSRDESDVRRRTTGELLTP